VFSLALVPYAALNGKSGPCQQMKSLLIWLVHGRRATESALDGGFFVLCKRAPSLQKEETGCSDMFFLLLLTHVFNL